MPDWYAHSPRIDYLCKNSLATPYMALQQRKCIVTLSRYQSHPLPGTLAQRQLKKDLDVFVHSPVQGRMVTLLSLVQSTAELESPLLSGFISMMVRCAPILDEEEAEMAIKEGIEKEMIAAIETYHPITLNWGHILHSDSRSRAAIPLIPGYPTDSSISDKIHHALESTKHRLSSTVLYPDYSNKTLGRRASYNMTLIPQYQDDDPPLSTLGLEQIYHRYGIRIQGETEARWAWKYNDLKPRIYYARGPDQYYASRYIQAIFNIIVDSLPVTGRFERFLAQTIRIPPEDTLFIYDYTSFTSRLHEITNFCEQLGVYYTGTMVTIVDSFQGIKRVDLGDLIREWNNTCQNFPEFATDGLSRDASEGEINVHNCGMLGVPGNISSCTFLHGIHLAILLQILLCKVIGDDAIGYGRLDSSKDLHSCLRNLGEISLPKMQAWGPNLDDRDDIVDSTWNYTKRPIDRTGDRVFIGEQVVFPSLGMLLSWSDKFHRSIPASDEYHRMKKVANSLLSFARQFDSRDLSEDEWTFVNRFVDVVAKKSGLAEYHNKPGGKILLYPQRVDTGRVVDDMIEDRWDYVVEIPEHENPSCRREEPRRLETFISPSHRMVKLMKDLGHADVRPRRKRVLVRDAEEELRSFFSKSRELVPMYDVYIFETCPDWMFEFLASSAVYRSAHCAMYDPSNDSDSESE